MEIRRATDRDASAITAVWLRSRRAAAPAIPLPVHGDTDVADFISAIVLPQRETWVATEDGRVVGLLVLDDDWIDQLYLDPGATGRGIGSELLAVAKRERPDGLQLWTFQANDGARRFYERHGFEVTGSTDGENEEGAPDVRYAWTPTS